jgi:hypothetical protein
MMNAQADRPQPIAPNIEQIPPELKALKQWVAWRYELAGEKWTKKPKQASGHNASSTNPKSWSTLDKIEKAYRNGGSFDGIGFVFTAGDPYVAIDLDHCINEAGTVEPWAKKIIDAATREGAYIEKSPSGTGVHIIGRGEPLAAGRKRNGAEIYSSGRYFTMTGHPVAPTPATIGTSADNVKLTMERIGVEPAEPTATPVARDSTLDDDTILQRARSATNGKKFAALFDHGDTTGYPSESEADAALAEILTFWTAKNAEAIERLMRRSALVRDKWDKHKTYLAGTIKAAIKHCKAVYGAPVGTVEDFYGYSPQHLYIYGPTGELWPGASVNASIAPLRVGGQRMKASDYLDKYRAVQQMTWCPGAPRVVKDRLVSEGGWREHAGANVYNLYRPPQIKLGDPTRVGPWIDHVRLICPAEAEHLVRCLAHRVQRPHEKINHGIVLGGGQGGGKDTALEPVKHAIGPWNWAEVSPTQLLGRFNPFAKSIVCRVSEARDLGESNRYAFYEHTKALMAAPPDVTRVDEKFIREYSVFNVTLVIITTNHKAGGIYLPPDDRRHFVAWSSLTKDDFTAEYWNSLWRWYAQGGIEHVAAYLATLDLSGFDPKAPPPKTAAWHDIVDANRAPEDAELADVIDQLGRPQVLTLDQLAQCANGQYADLYGWLQDRRNRRQVPHRLESAGYSPVRNPTAKDGYFIISGARQAVYGRRELSDRERIAAAIELARRAKPRGEL